MDPDTLRSFMPVLQSHAGIEKPWQGILLGAEKPPTNSTACLTVISFVMVTIYSRAARLARIFSDISFSICERKA